MRWPSPAPLLWVLAGMLGPVLVWAQAGRDVWDIFHNQSALQRDEFVSGAFPAGFGWSTSTAAYQIEGGWNADGKGESVWDHFVHTRPVFGGGTGDVTCDSYHRIAQDMVILNGIGLSYYRFSISWSRIFPKGDPRLSSGPNEPGVRYYNDLINNLTSAGIQPMVTLFHWDLPQALQDTGGWVNDSTIAAYVAYAEFCFATFGDRVKFWFTFNEPYNTAWLSNGLGVTAPGVYEPLRSPYVVTHNVLRAHARAWHVYDGAYRAAQGGRVSIVLNTHWAEPRDPSNRTHVDAAERYVQFSLGWFAHPIYGRGGGYPRVMADLIADRDRPEPSRLPSFTPEEQAYVQGTSDFFSINSYSTRLVWPARRSELRVGYDADMEVNVEMDPDWPTAAAGWHRSVPWGMRRLLNFIDREYGGPEVWVTENGWSDHEEDGLDDAERIFYHHTYVNEVFKALHLDHVRVRGYTAWTLMDNFEWTNGFTERFGLHYVNFSDPERARTPKRSVGALRKLAHDNGFPGSAARPLVTLHGRFPAGFQWGVATAAYQVEGGWNADGKGPSIWDSFTTRPGNVAGMATGRVACNSYQLFAQDVKAVRALGAGTYLFSLSWPRLLPDGTVPGGLNEPGVAYYNRLLDALVQAGVRPAVTLYHWDLPQALQDVGGWENDTVVEHFRAYASWCFQLFGDRVHTWVTISDPLSVAWLGHGNGKHAPGLHVDPGRAPYVVARNLLRAHALAWHEYDANFRAKQGGRIALALSADWVEPLDPGRTGDVEAVQRYLDFTLGWFGDPVFLGHWPPSMLSTVDPARLPPLSTEDSALLRGTSDFLAIVHTTTRRVLPQRWPASDAPPEPSYLRDRDAEAVPDWTWRGTGSHEVRAVPWGLRHALGHVAARYPDAGDVQVLGNGAPQLSDEDLNDTSRMLYHSQYINELLKAISLDGLNVSAYFAWSLLDGFSWEDGFTRRWGLYSVARDDPALARVPKQSVQDLATIIRCNGFPEPSKPDPCLFLTEPDTTKPLHFLGLSLSAEDGEVALWTLFGLTLVLTATLCLGVGLAAWRAKTRKGKRPGGLEIDTSVSSML
ncbi:lactase/phlorizin hydrolase-like [Petromyzon marinus]|uniref:lactase/phlorizin hydrolase-like n=1 Tax=Petromyzon marinus TaxID=7757 RepID=UPI003F70AD72